MKHPTHYGKTFLIATFIALTAIQPVQAMVEPATLTLATSVTLALENNPAMKIAQSLEEKSAWNLKQARAYNGFTLGYNYTLGRTDQAPTWYNNTTSLYPYSYNAKATKPSEAIIDFPAWSTIYNAYSHQLTLQYPLYTGGKIENTIRLAKHGSAAATLGITTTKQQLVLDVTTSYFNVLQARNLAEVALQGVDDLDGHLKNVQKYYDAGTVSLSDVLQTQVRLSNARNNLIKAQSSITLARYKLNTVIGLPLQNQAALADTFNQQPSSQTVDDTIAIALKNRPEMAQATLRIEMAKDKVKIAHSGHLPTVALLGTETWADTNPASSKERNSWQVGMNVQFNVFDNGLTNAQIKQAQQEVIETQQQYNQLTDKISLQVCQAYLSVQESAARITNNQVAVQQSQTDYQLAQQRYEAGISINLDVMDAQLAMVQAKTNYVQARYDLNNSMAQLDNAMGLIR